MNILCMCTYKSPVFGTEALEIILISDYQATGLLLQMFSINFMTYCLILCVQSNLVDSKSLVLEIFFLNYQQSEL